MWCKGKQYLPSEKWFMNFTRHIQLGKKKMYELLKLDSALLNSIMYVITLT